MARRFTGGRRRRGFSVGRKPSQFASGRARDGRAVAWESIGGNFGFQSLGNEFVNTTYNIVGPPQYSQHTRIAVPTNLTRGQLTLERVRGYSKFYLLQDIDEPTGQQYYPPNMIVDGNGSTVGVLWESLQLVPTINGLLDFTINDNPVLQIANAASQSSNRIIWQRTHHLKLGGPIPVAALDMWEYMPSTGNEEIDVKTRRRFDREQWTLIHSVEVPIVEAVAALQVQCSFNMRAIFRSYDSV